MASRPQAKSAGSSSKARRSPGRTPASADAAQIEPLSEAKAKEALFTERAEPIGANVPADAAGREAASPNKTFSFGNREFSVAPRALAGRTLDILPDLPDIRDRIYQPHLRALRTRIYPTLAFPVRDQGQSASCTGYSLAHVVDCLLYRETIEEPQIRVSARMLYEMAKRNDEWTGTAYEGSSIRGALSGFHRNGVCSEAIAPDRGSASWVLTYARAKEARDIRLGAYYRLQPDLSDYHAAINEIGAIYVSAQIHSNWEAPENGRILPGGRPAGGHAFVLVGYDADGFWVLNSWGDGWGNGGIAHWTYEDWAATVMDAWVLQLGVKAPSAFSASPRQTPANTATPQVSTAPNRSDIVGHFVNIDDGRYVLGGRYGSPTPQEMGETVRRLTIPDSNGGQGYDHLVIYAHGGLNTLDDEANRIATWRRNDVFGRNGIYNFHLMWGSGFLDEAFGPLSTTQAGRAGGLLGDLLFETGPGKTLGRAAWRNMKQDAEAAFRESSDYDGGVKGLTPLLGGVDKENRRPVLHLVGHSAGSIVLGRLLGALSRFRLKSLQLGSIHLMAPACTVEFFNQFYGPYLKGTGAVKLQDKVYLYNMSGPLELQDTVGVAGLAAYGRSLLYLVSRAYEENPGTPIAGMQIFAPGLGQSSKLSIDYATSAATASTSHGGFDNDVATLSSIMTRVLGKPVPKPPLRDELIGY